MDSFHKRTSGLRPHSLLLPIALSCLRSYMAVHSPANVPIYGSNARDFPSHRCTWGSLSLIPTVDGGCCTWMDQGIRRHVVMVEMSSFTFPKVQNFIDESSFPRRWFWATLDGCVHWPCFWVFHSHHVGNSVLDEVFPLGTVLPWFSLRHLLIELQNGPSAIECSQPACPWWTVPKAGSDIPDS